MEQVLLRMTPQDVNVILEALTAQPLGKVFNTYVRLQQQLQVVERAQAQPIPAQPAEEKHTNGDAIG